ncbi:MAG: hypothetical protein FJ125_16840 [Deltaproteobacteria bacterium]|nr:hypothetical protein [Deltaproteobacteria bacterium]
MTCMMSADPSCKLNCVRDATGLSEACSACFAAALDCTISQCMAQCVVNPLGPECAACRAEKCDPAFIECSGLDP